MGDEAIVTLSQGEDTIRAKVRGTCPFEIDHLVTVAADPPHIHLFDAETSERIDALG
jgi:hypothetical protein